MTDIEHDFETVREGLEVNAHEAAQALSRIEDDWQRELWDAVEEKQTELERLREGQEKLNDDLKAEHAEVERLTFRATNCEESTQARVVERLKTQVENQLEHIKGHHSDIDDRWMPELERLRGTLSYIAEAGNLRGCAHCAQAIARRALEEE